MPPFTLPPPVIALRGAAPRLAFALLLLATALACGEDQPDFMSPGPGDFVQFVQPDVNETLTAAELARRTVAIVLNFFPAEGFGFGSLQSFRYDGEEVTDEVQEVREGDPPEDRVSFSFDPEEIEQGGHTVEVVYSDSRGVVHFIRWSFTIEG